MASHDWSLLVYLVLICTSFHALTVTCNNGSTPSANPVTNSTKHCQKWIGPLGHRVITGDVNGSDHFWSVQAAVNAIPDNNAKEKVVVPETFQGAGRDVTMIEWHDRANDPGPNGQQLLLLSLLIISLQGISASRTPRQRQCQEWKGGKAAGFPISEDKAYFLACGFYGAQDTLCDDAGRHYFKECYIEGFIDFKGVL